MYKIYLAVGNEGVEKYIKSQKPRLEKMLNDTVNFVGATVYKEGALQGIKDYHPDVVILREGLHGNMDILDLIYKIRLESSGTRIVLITKTREAGDAFLATTVQLGVYDLIVGDKISVKDLLKKIVYPTKFIDVAHYIPKVTIDEKTNKKIFSAPDVDALVKQRVEEIGLNQNSEQQTQPDVKKPAAQEQKDVSKINFLKDSDDAKVVISEVKNDLHPDLVAEYTVPEVDIPKPLESVGITKPLNEEVHSSQELPQEKQPIQLDTEKTDNQFVKPALNTDKFNDKTESNDLEDDEEIVDLDEPKTVAGYEQSNNTSLNLPVNKHVKYEDDDETSAPTQRLDTIKPPVFTETPVTTARTTTIADTEDVGLDAIETIAPIAPLMTPVDGPLNTSDMDSANSVTQNPYTSETYTPQNKTQKNTTSKKGFSLFKKSKQNQKTIPAQIITFWGGSSGVGNSQIAFNTAIALANKGYHVIYVDLNDRFSSIESMMQLGFEDLGIDTMLKNIEENKNDKVGHGIGSISKILPFTDKRDFLYKTYTNMPSSLNFAFFSQHCFEGKTGIHYNVDYLKDLNLMFLMDFGYDVIILDAPSDAKNRATQLALAYANKVFVTLNQDKTVLSRMLKQMKYLSYNRINVREKCFFVINRFESNAFSYNNLANFISMNLQYEQLELLSIPNLSKDFVNSIYNGTPIILSTKNKELIKTISDIVTLIES